MATSDSEALRLLDRLDVLFDFLVGEEWEGDVQNAPPTLRRESVSIGAKLAIVAVRLGINDEPFCYVAAGDFGMLFFRHPDFRTHFQRLRTHILAGGDR